MRKLSIVALIVLLSVSVTLTTGIASEEEKVTVTMNPEDVVAIDVENTNLSIDVDQGMLEQGKQYQRVGCITIDVWAISNWKVFLEEDGALCGFTCGNTNAKEDALEIYSRHLNQWIPVTDGHAIASGTNNMDNPYRKSHCFRLNLAKLGDQVAGSDITGEPESGSTTRVNHEQWEMLVHVYDSTDEYSPPGC